MTEVPARLSWFLGSNVTQKSVLLFFLSAIYNYNPRGEQELCLQVGDAVHLLEELEGK